MCGAAPVLDGVMVPWTDREEVMSRDGVMVPWTDRE